MKVSKIEMTQKGNFLTYTEGEDRLDKVIYTAAKPPWELGGELSPQDFVLSPSGKSYFYQTGRKPEHTAAGEKKPDVQRYTKSGNEDWWNREVFTTARNSTIQATELVKVFVNPGVGLQEALGCVQSTATVLFVHQMKMWAEREKK